MITTYIKKKKRRSPLSFEVLGQCACCKDLFSVYIVQMRDNYFVDETPRLKWRQSDDKKILVHRPGLCNGEVKLYGSTN